MSRLEEAIMRLYEDESLRGELTDAAADRLLRWAEDRLTALDAAAPDDAAFAAGERALIETLLGVNRDVGAAFATAAAADFSAQAAPIDELALIDQLLADRDAPAPAPELPIPGTDKSPSAAAALGMQISRLIAGAADADEQPDPHPIVGADDDLHLIDPDN